MEKGLKNLQSAARSHRRNKNSPTSSTSPTFEEFDDSGLGEDRPSSEAGNHDHQSQHHSQSDHQQQRQSSYSHQVNSLSSTPGTAYSSLHSSVLGQNGYGTTSTTPYPSQYQLAPTPLPNQQSRLPSFSSGFGHQMPTITTLPSIFNQAPAAPISASY